MFDEKIGSDKDRRVATFLTLVGVQGAELPEALAFLAVLTWIHFKHPFFHSSSLKYLLDNMNKVNFIAQVTFALPESRGKCKHLCELTKCARSVPQNLQ